MGDFLKPCPKCGESKPLAEYQKDRSTADGLSCYCRPCHKAKSRAYYLANREAVVARHGEHRRKNPDYHKEWYKQNRHRTWASALWSRYGLTPGQYDAILEAQGGVCAICGGSDNGKRRLAVDHCHTSNTVRGILCGSCNKGIGNLKESERVLLSAIQYLRQAHRLKVG